MEEATQQWLKQVESVEELPSIAMNRNASLGRLPAAERHAFDPIHTNTICAQPSTNRNPPRKREEERRRHQNTKRGNDDRNPTNNAEESVHRIAKGKGEGSVLRWINIAVPTSPFLGHSLLSLSSLSCFGEVVGTNMCFGGGVLGTHEGRPDPLRISAVCRSVRV